MLLDCMYLSFIDFPFNDVHCAPDLIPVHVSALDVPASPLGEGEALAIVEHALVVENEALAWRIRSFLYRVVDFRESHACQFFSVTGGILIIKLLFLSLDRYSSSSILQSTHLVSSCTPCRNLHCTPGG